MAGIPVSEGEEDAVREGIKETIFYGLLEKDFGARTKVQDLARLMGIELMAMADGAEDLLPDENSLCARYKVGRSILREAVKILVGKGMLSVRRGIGTRIESRQSWSVFDPEVMGWQLSVSDERFWRDLGETRSIIEISAVRLAAVRAQESHKSLLSQAIQIMGENAEAVEAVIAARALFHSTLLKSSGNKLLEGMTALVFANLVFHFDLQPIQSKQRLLTKQYAALLHALDQQNAKRAEEAICKIVRLDGIEQAERSMS